MKTKTITLYSFKELSREAQKKALEKYRDINTPDFWHDYIIDDEKETLATQGFEDAKIYYTGFWSQGDGASFEATLNWPKYYATLPKALQEKWKGYTGEKEIVGGITKRSYQYEHEYTMGVSLECNDNSNAPDGLEDRVLQDAREEAKRIYKRLQKEYEYLTSDEMIIEAFEANGYTFREDGTLEN